MIDLFTSKKGIENDFFCVLTVVEFLPTVFITGSLESEKSPLLSDVDNQFILNDSYIECFYYCEKWKIYCDFHMSRFSIFGGHFVLNKLI